MNYFVITPDLNLCAEAIGHNRSHYSLAVASIKAVHFKAKGPSLALRAMGLSGTLLKICLPIALLDALLDFAFREVTLKRAQIIDEQLAVEMVRLVRNAARFKIHYIKRHFAAI